MEKTFKKICAEHGLTAISVTTHTNQDANHTSVFLHWAANNLTSCSIGTAQTFEAALELALVEKNIKILEAA